MYLTIQHKQYTSFFITKHRWGVKANDGSFSLFLLVFFFKHT